MSNSNIHFYARLPFNQLEDRLAGTALHKILEIIAPSFKNAVTSAGIDLDEINQFIYAGSAGYEGNSIETKILNGLNLTKVEKRTKIGNGYLSTFKALDFASNNTTNGLTLIMAMDNLSGTPHLVRNDFVKSLADDDEQLDKLTLPGMALKYSYADIINDTVWPTYENLTNKHALTQRDLDKYAYLSRAKYKEAVDKKFYTDEIIPLTFQFEKGSFHEYKSDAQGAFQPEAKEYNNATEVFPGMKKTTNHNVALPADGMVFLITSNDKKPKHKSFATVGAYVEEYGDPADYLKMGERTIKKACENAGLSVSDVDFFEIHENHPITVLGLQRALDIDLKKVNPKGGSLAIGDAIAATGGRLISSATSLIKHTPFKNAVVNISSPLGFSGSVVLQEK